MSQWYGVKGLTFTVLLWTS